MPKRQLIAWKGWNQQHIAAYLSTNAFQLEQDNDGQFIVYTGLTEDSEGHLITIGNDEIEND